MLGLPVPGSVHRGQPAVGRAATQGQAGRRLVLTRCRR